MELTGDRPNPDELLAQIQKSETKRKKGRLKIYLGMCAGVGKTFAMLQDASKARGKGIDILIAYVETHGRSDTEFLLFYLPQLPRKKIDYRGVILEEMDIDEILRIKPQLVVVDELAHTNAPGSRHKKRYQDVLEILEHGIDVYTALNVQHIESYNDVVTQITGIHIHEKVPDSIIDMADEVELVDISPDELLQRLADGKVYTADKSEHAVKNFFKKVNLTALREISLRVTAKRVDRQLKDYMQDSRIKGPWKSGQRLLLAIGATKQSAELIRWAKRISSTLDAAWIVLYVETVHPLSDEQKRTVKENIELAKLLKGDVITVTGTDVVKEILKTAYHENVSQIILGKSRDTGLISKLTGRDIVSRLLKESGKIDVYIVNTEPVEKYKKFDIKRLISSQSPLAHYFISNLIVAVVALILYFLTDIVGYQTCGFILLLTVTLLPLLFGPGPVITSAITGTAIWDFFFIPPKFTMYIRKSEDLMMLFTFLIVASVTGWLTSRLKQRERIISQREEQTRAMYSLANNLSSARGKDEVFSCAKYNIQKVFNCELYVSLSDDGRKLNLTELPVSDLKVTDKDYAIAQWVFDNKKEAGNYTDTLSNSDITFYPLTGTREAFGVIGLKLNKNLYGQYESLIEIFINQIGAAIEREVLNLSVRNTIITEESEKLYKNLFSSISHELKTPISAILGASALLSKNTGSESDRKLISEINIASDRLNKLVENLLDITRIESGRIEINKQWCDVQDIINSSLHQLESQLHGKNVKIRIAKNIQLIFADFVLVEQAVKNIVLNAALYTPAETTIEINVRKDTDSDEIIISDNGPGIAEEHLEKIFDKFYRGDNQKTGGTGLGLAIAKGFIEAHNGTITVRNKIEGGAQFIISLPSVKTE